MGGYVDPTVTERTGLPLLAPFAGELVEMRGWASGSRWIGCGVVRAGDGEQVVVLVAERAAPLPDALPDGDRWLDALLRVTGWAARDATQPWEEIEAELGTALPGDYKRLCQAFGVGEFSQAVGVDPRRDRAASPTARAPGGFCDLLLRRAGGPSAEAYDFGSPTPHRTCASRGAWANPARIA